MTLNKIYFDMDGVLADFDRGVRELCGITPLNQEEHTKASDDAMWAAIRGVDHFYDKLEPVPGAQELFRDLYNKYGNRCEILTGIPKEKRGIATAGEDKMNWIHRLFGPEIVVHIVYKEQKKEYCTGPECILVDDFSTNINEWQAGGGTGIRFSNPEDARMQMRELGIL